MTSIEVRLDALERTVKLQRLALMAGMAIFVVALSGGAMVASRPDSLKGKELLIEDENGKTVAKLGAGGSGGVEFVLGAGTEKGEREIRFSIDDQGTVVSTAFDGASYRSTSNAEGASILLVSKEGNRVETNAAGSASLRFVHKDEKFSRLMMNSDPKLWPTIILREQNDTIRWQSPKAGR